MRPVEIDIKSKLDVMQSLNLSEADFDTALEMALEDLAGTPTCQLPAPADIPIDVGGQVYRLGDLASIDVKFSGSQAALSI